jgi:hypothetical protein
MNERQREALRKKKFCYEFDGEEATILFNLVKFGIEKVQNVSKIDLCVMERINEKLIKTRDACGEREGTTENNRVC